MMDKHKNGSNLGTPEKIVLNALCLYGRCIRFNTSNIQFSQNSLLAGFHEELFAMSCGLPPFTGIASKSKDGELITYVLRRLKHDVIRGSSSRGGNEVLNDMLKNTFAKPLAFTVDGPRGPRREVKPGIVILAIKKQMPIYCIRAVYKGFRFNSWDRFHLPKPFSKVALVTSGPFFYDKTQGIRESCKDLEKKLLELKPNY